MLDLAIIFGRKSRRIVMNNWAKYIINEHGDNFTSTSVRGIRDLIPTFRVCTTRIKYNCHSFMPTVNCSA